MYQRQLPTDRGQLRQLAEDLLKALQRSGEVPTPGQLDRNAYDLLLKNTELNLQLEELKRVNELLTSALNGTPDAMFIKDREGRYVLLNEAAANFVGRPWGEVLGLDDRELFDAAGAAHDRERDQWIVSTGESVVEEKVLTAAGVQRTYWSKKSPLRDQSGRVTGIVGSARDISAIKQTERQLRENEARLAEAQEIGGVGSFEIALPSWQGRCSPPLCKIFGFENDEPFRDVPAFFRKYRHPDDHARSDVSRAKLLEGGTSDEIEHRYLHPDGRERMLHIRRRVIRDAAGKPIKLVGTVQDVTDRRRAEEELRASEARYRLFTDHITDALYLHGPDGVVRDVNQRACDALGYAREELIGAMPNKFDPDVTPEKFAEILQLRRSKQLIVFESRHQRKDGSIFPVEVRIQSFDWEGEIYSISLAQDITQRKANEQALRESERRFRELADAIPQIVWLAGPDGGLRHLNARAVEYTGVQITNLTGWSWENVIHPDDIAATIRDWTEILRSGIPRPLEFRIRRADGEYRWHITRQVASRDAAGNITQWYGTCTDMEDQKRTLEALRASEERYRRLFNSIPDPMFVFDQHSLRFLAVNDAAVERYGYSRTELLSLGMLDIRPLEDAPVVLQRLQESQPKFEDRGLWRHRKKSGELIEVEVTAHTLDLDGKMATIALARDVTARRRAEAEARRTAELLRVVAEGTPDAVFVKDRLGRYLLFNPAASRFVGKPVEEVLGRDDTTLFGPEDAAIIMAVDRRVMETQQAETNEERLTAAGVTRWYLAMKAPYRDGEGRVVGTIGISRDITERKEAEEAFRKVSAIHETIIHTAGEGICLCTPTGDDQELRFTVWNDQMSALTGYSQDEVNELGMYSLLFPDAQARERARGQLQELLRGHPIQRTEWEITRKDGERRLLSISISVIELDGQSPSFVSMIQDITVRRRYAEELAMRQAELRHVSRLTTVGQMVAALSHEVAQPLAAISNFAASSTTLLAAKEPLQLEVVRQHIDQISQQSRRAAAIIHRLRDYSRKGNTQPSPCDLHDLLRSSVEMLSHELRRGEVQVILAFSSQPARVQADPVQLQQVFVNLLLNARDALQEIVDHPRVIVLRTLVEAKLVTVEVEDNGPGLAEEVAGRLYEPFVTTKAQGMGIGLSICRSILQDHRGEIEYHPLKQGGTSFLVRLALSTARSTST
jgi:PAS domain S-box-containing protein